MNDPLIFNAIDWQRILICKTFNFNPIFMKKKLIIGGIVASGLFVLSLITRRKSSGKDGSGTNLRSTTHEFEVKNIEGVWRVFKKGEETESDIIAERNDKIIWRVRESEAQFTFQEEKIFGKKVLKTFIRRANAKILHNSPRGTYEYEIFINKDNVYALGQSPPRIIVM